MTASDNAKQASADRVDGIVPSHKEDVNDLKLGRKAYKGQHFYNRVSSSDVADGSETIDNRVGGTYGKLKNGQRIPMTKVSNNPSLELPQVMAMKLFGQSPIFKLAVDQVIPKPIGVFPSPQQGAGLSAFNLSNASAFSSPMQLLDAVANMVTNGQTDNLTGSLMSSHITDITSAVTSATGATSTSLIDLTRADHAIPFLSAFHTAVSGGSAAFGIDTFAKGLAVSHEVVDYLTKLSGGEATYKSLLDTISSVSSLTSSVSTNITAIVNAVSSISTGAASLSSLSQAATGSINSLGGIVGQITTPATPGSGTQILAHIIKSNGAF